MDRDEHGHAEHGEVVSASLDPAVRNAIDELRDDPHVHTEAASGRTGLDAHEPARLLNPHRARQDEGAWAGGQRSRIGAGGQARLRVRDATSRRRPVMGR